MYPITARLLTVPGSYENIKVTTPEDIALAEYLILKDEKE